MGGQLGFISSELVDFAMVLCWFKLNEPQTTYKQRKIEADLGVD